MLEDSNSNVLEEVGDILLNCLKFSKENYRGKEMRALFFCPKRRGQVVGENEQRMI